MNRLILGVALGVVFGAIDVVVTIQGTHPGITTTILLQAFFSRFAIGVLAANVVFRMDAILAGAITGLLVSLPDAFALNSYPGILGTGLFFGAIAGWAAKIWGSRVHRHSVYRNQY